MRKHLAQVLSQADHLRRRAIPAPVERPVDVAQELWDYGWYFALLAALGYVLNPPSDVSQSALAELFSFAAPWLWGSATAALVFFGGVICSYRERWLATGYLVLIATSTAWAGWFLAGVVVYDAPDRGWVSFLVYANIASRGYRLKERL